MLAKKNGEAELEYHESWRDGRRVGDGVYPEKSYWLKTNRHYPDAAIKDRRNWTYLAEEEGS